MPWIERVRTEQPLDAGVGVDWDNPITRGLRVILNGADNQVAPWTIIGGASRSLNQTGISRLVNGSNQALSTPLDLTNTKAVTVVSLMTPVGYFSPYNMFWEFTADGNSVNGGFALYSNNSSARIDIGCNGGGTDSANYSPRFATGVPVSLAATYDHTKPNGQQIGLFTNGDPTAVTVSGSLGGSGSFGNSTLYLGARTASTLWGYNQYTFFVLFDCRKTDAEIKSLYNNPWQLFEKERIWVPVAAGGPVTHATTGALTGQLGSIAGTAAHVAVHGASGTPTGQLGSVVGSAARLRAFASTGALTGPGSAVVGSATRAGGTTTHDATGTPTGQGSAVVGTAAHVAIHGTSGTLVGTSALLAGTAVHNIPHGTSGDLTGPGSVVVGSALNGLASVTKSGVNRLWLIDYYTKEFAAKERLRNPEPAKTKVVAKKRAAEVAAKVEASVAKAEKDLATLTKSMKDVQDAQVFIYNAIQQAKQAPQAEPVDFMVVAKRYEKKVQQEEHELLLLAMVL